MTTTTSIAANRAAVIAALRAGAVKGHHCVQIQGYLMQRDDTRAPIGFCALGVAMLVWLNMVPDEARAWPSYFPASDWELFAQWLGMERASLDVWTHLNDAGQTFAQIADAMCAAWNIPTNEAP